jgi:hypothetical protein
VAALPNFYSECDGLAEPFELGCGGTWYEMGFWYDVQYDLDAEIELYHD